ncbi:hypothetical protein GCM10022233_67620 [Streptomyces shaanxiensis]|uniref:Uncharacterized protein n=1 Tax=Streptomyces shaanxiensis TaxID=653357 RepID=A0ABP7W0Y1_9ACTN
MNGGGGGGGGARSGARHLHGTRHLHGSRAKAVTEGSVPSLTDPELGALLRDYDTGRAKTRVRLTEGAGQ